jgi:hypothetical protein
VTSASESLSAARYTIVLATEILTRMAEGERLHRICQDARLPAEATVRDWADNRQHPAFMDAFRRAQRHQAHRWFQQAVEIADDSKPLRLCQRSAAISFAAALGSGRPLAWRLTSSASVSSVAGSSACAST